MDALAIFTRIHVARRRRRIDQLAKGLAVVRRDAEQIGNDHGHERRRNLVYQLAPARRDDILHHLFGIGAHEFLVGLEARGREQRVEQRTGSCVPLTIIGDHQFHRIAWRRRQLRGDVVAIDIERQLH